MIVRAGIFLFRLVRAVGFTFPQKFRFPLCLGHPSSPDKERIAQAIHKFDDLPIERFFPGQTNADPFGPTADGPRLVQRRRHFAAGCRRRAAPPSARSYVVALLILAGALVAIAAATVIVEHFRPRPVQHLDKVPPMPPGVSR